MAGVTNVESQAGKLKLPNITSKIHKIIVNVKNNNKITKNYGYQLLLLDVYRPLPVDHKAD